MKRREFITLLGGAAGPIRQVALDGPPPAKNQFAI